MTPIRIRRAWALPVLSALALPLPALAQTPAPAPIAAVVPESRDPGFDLSVANVMRGEDLIGHAPEQIRWSEDSRWIYFSWQDPASGDTVRYTYRVPATGGEPERLADSVARRVAPAAAGDWSLDRRTRAVIRGGDVYVIEANGRERRITDTPGNERQPQLSPDGDIVYFLADNDIHAVALAGGPIRQLTDFRTDDEPAEREATGLAAYLEDAQRELFDVVREREAERDAREAENQERGGVRPTWLGRGNRLLSAEVSPSGRYALVAVGGSADDNPTLVANFVTESGYTEEIRARSKVGDVQAGQRAAIVDLSTGEATWLEPEPADRDLSVSVVGWAPRDDRALLTAIPADYKDRWIYTATPNGTITTVDHIRDDAWVGGPGLFTAGWMPEGDAVYFVSERSGWAHLYTVPATGGEPRPITSGDWEVRDVQLAPGRRGFLVSTSEAHPGEQHLYRVPLSGGERARLTTMPGWNDAFVSPDGRRVAILNALPDAPPELYVSRLGDDGPRRVTKSTTAEFDRGPWIQPEIRAITASDGEPVFARVYRPADLGAEPNGAAVIFVHGAGYLQNAHRGWSSYSREYMFNHLLASLGYVVLDMDYRGSAGYGAAWRTGIYRHMGGKDLSDHVDGARWLVENEGVDPQRVGIYGGSYGGFITLMAMFTEPDVFSAGAALRSVTDWAHYNHWYTSRILNQPQDDPAAYRRSSPIYFAEGLEGDLLMAHGMVDTNVHFQDIVRLTQRLIELGKTDWELAVYPVENHGFVRTDSWTDEYRRILELFEESIGQ